MLQHDAACASAESTNGVSLSGCSRVSPEDVAKCEERYNKSKLVGMGMGMGDRWYVGFGHA